MPLRAAQAGRDAQGDAVADLACNEDYWSQIQRCFDTEQTLINLNNGGVFAPGKLEKGGRGSNSETFHRNPAG